MKEIEIYNKIKNYKVYINYNMDKLKSVFYENKIKKNTKLFLITDNVVFDIYKDFLEYFKKVYDCKIYFFNHEERNKNSTTVKKIYDFLFANKANRDSVLIAFGGEVVGDMTGFVASTYMRGIRYMSIPTTLLSQVDSCIGGKTGYNYKGIKNLIGSFYNPIFVYISTEFIKTLNKKQFINGISEIIKYGIIKDKKLLEFIKMNYKGILEQENDKLIYIIKQSLKNKANIIEKDFKDLGIRNVLNFGHTVGHGIEVYSNYSISHGEGVALGSLVAIKLSEKKFNLCKNFYEEIKELYSKFGLPIRYKVDNYSTILYAINRDKKNSRNIRFVLLEDMYRCKIKVKVTFDEVIDALKESISLQ